MRIAEVTATFPPYRGGTGNIAYQNAKILSELHHDVTVFTPRLGGPIDAPFEIAYLDPLLRVGNASVVPSLTRRLKGFDLVHLHYPFIGAESVLVACKSGRVPLLVTYHNRLEESHPVKKILFNLYNGTLEPLILRHATVIASVNHDHFHHLFPHYQDFEVPNGVDTNLFTPGNRLVARRALDLNPSDPVVLFVGALDQAHRFKNVPLLLRAIAPMEQVQLVVVGGGDLQPSLVDYATQLGLDGRVRFAGSRTPVELPDYYRAADVTVLPSNKTESFGLVLVESMACGTPVIASDLPGLRSVVTHGRTGLLVPPDDLAALHTALRRAFSRPHERLQMGSQARTRVERSFAWSVVKRRLEDACLAAAGMSPTLRIAEGAVTHEV